MYDNFWQESMDPYSQLCRLWWVDYFRTFEPAHEIMVLFVLRKFILQTRMRSHPVWLDVWFLIGPFVYFNTLCVRIAKALARLRGWAGSPEPSLVADAISTKISWAGSFFRSWLFFNLLWLSWAILCYFNMHTLHFFSHCLACYGIRHIGLVLFRTSAYIGAKQASRVQTDSKQDNSPHNDDVKDVSVLNESELIGPV